MADLDRAEIKDGGIVEVFCGDKSWVMSPERAVEELDSKGMLEYFGVLQREGLIHLGVSIVKLLAQLVESQQEVAKFLSQMSTSQKESITRVEAAQRPNLKETMKQAMDAARELGLFPPDLGGD